MTRNSISKLNKPAGKTFNIASNRVMWKETTPENAKQVLGRKGVKERDKDQRLSFLRCEGASQDRQKGMHCDVDSLPASHISLQMTFLTVPLTHLTLPNAPFKPNSNILFRKKMFKDWIHGLRN